MPFHVVLPDAAKAVTAAGPLNADPSVVAAIRHGSAQSGTRFDVMLASATLESGLNPSAQAGTSSAKGLFQFVDQTWLSAVRQFGASHGLASEAAAVVRRGNQLTVEDPKLRERILNLRDDPTVASELAGDHLRSIADKLTETLGHPPDAAEIYLGHFLGSAGAGQMLQAVQATPNRAAADLLPKAASANPAMFRGANGAPLSVAQFMAHLRGKVSAAYAALGVTMPQSQPGVAGLQAPTTSADVAMSGATGWGSGLALHTKRPVETQLMASLLDVFTRLDKSNHGGSQRQPRLPPAVLTALQSVQDSVGLPQS